MLTYVSSENCRLDNEVLKGLAIEPLQCMPTVRRRRARSRILHMSQQAETFVAQRCAPTPVGQPLRVRHHGGAAALAIVISTRPPAGDRQVDVRPTIQLLTSLITNAPELYATARVLLLATDDAELAALKPQVGGVLLRSFATALRERSSNASFADVHRMPEAIGCLAPRPFASVEDLLRYGAIWRTLKRAYGASIAVDEMRASHVLVTDADGFVWKDVSVSAIIQSSNTLWYADHRGRSPTLDIERSPHVDTHARARSYCSMHPWVSKLLKIGAWEAHGPRMAIGRDWQAWEELITKEELLPAPDSDIADDPLLVLNASIFAELWNHLEGTWRAPFADAVLLSLLMPADLYKHCVRGDVLFLELMYRSFVFKFHSRASARTVGGHVYRYQFRNSTAVLETTYPVAASPVGSAYRSVLPGAADHSWFHPAPSGFSRLWLHLNGSLQVREAIRAVYGGGARSSSTPLVAARLDLRGASRCEAVDLILQMPGGAAALMLPSSPAPATLWAECEGLKATRSKLGSTLSGLGGGAGPFIDAAVDPPAYLRHRGEWVPEY